MVASACQACGGLKVDRSGVGVPSAKAWWAGESYQEVLEEEREKTLSPDMIQISATCAIYNQKIQTG